MTRLDYDILLDHQLDELDGYCGSWVNQWFTSDGTSHMSNYVWPTRDGAAEHAASVLNQATRVIFADGTEYPVSAITMVVQLPLAEGEQW